MSYRSKWMMPLGVEFDPNFEELEVRRRAYDELMAAGEAEAAALLLERPYWWEGGPVPPFRASDFAQ